MKIPLPDSGLKLAGRNRRIRLGVTLCMAFTLVRVFGAQVITLEANAPGRVFEGVGGISSTTSLLLADYPEPARSQILDLLFKPKFGASVQHLKVEMGAGENSTCASEPSHAFSREELAAPRPRGMEFWLMREARRRNPAILLDALPWSFPGFLKPDPKKSIWSEDMTSYYLAYLQTARTQGVELDYLAATQNEVGTDFGWIMRSLRPTLDVNGFKNVKLHVAEVGGFWDHLSAQVHQTPERRAAITALSAHYVNGRDPWTIDQPPMSGGGDATNPSDAVKATGLPLWAGEEWSNSGKTWGGPGALYLGRLINKLYVRDRITKLEVWPLFDAIPNGLQWYTDTGVLRADSPWSGYYEVWPAVWAMAHTSQFAQPGWRYLDSACGQLDSKTWKGTYVTLRDPQSDDWSMIVCTGAPTRIAVKVGAGLKRGPVHVWRSTERALFVQLADPKSDAAGTLKIELEGDAIYTLTTTTGQRKGGFDSIAPETAFPLPWQSEHATQASGEKPRYLVDQAGSFEVAALPGRGNVIQQIAPQQGVRWGGTGYAGIRRPYTVFGDPRWSGYTLSAQVKIVGGEVEIGGRWDGTNRADNHFHKLSYRWVLAKDGAWRLCYGDTVLQEGRVADFDGEAWHGLKLVLDKSSVLGFIDGRPTAAVEHKGPLSGMAVLASSYDTNYFDQIKVEPLPNANRP